MNISALIADRWKTPTLFCTFFHIGVGILRISLFLDVLVLFALCFLGVSLFLYRLVRS